MERITKVENYIDFTTSLHCDDARRLLANRIVCGLDMMKRANVLVVRDGKKNDYAIKVRPGYECFLGEEFMDVSSEDFDKAWTHLEQIKVLDELDVTARNVVFNLPNIYLTREFSGKYSIHSM